MNELNIALTDSGLSVTAQRYQNGAAVGSAISLSEIGSTAYYTGHMTGAAGTYQILFRAGGENVGAGDIRWDGTAEVLAATPANIPTAAQNATQVWSAASRTTTGGTVDTLTNSPNVPSAAQIATQVWNNTARTITGGTVDTLTNSPNVPSAAAIATQVRTELAVELARVDQPISTRATPANIPTSDITAIKTKTDALDTARLAKVSTVDITGAQLAAALNP